MLSNADCACPILFFRLDNKQNVLKIFCISVIRLLSNVIHQPWSSSLCTRPRLVSLSLIVLLDCGPFPWYYHYFFLPIIPFVMKDKMMSSDMAIEKTTRLRLLQWEIDYWSSSMNKWERTRRVANQFPQGNRSNQHPHSSACIGIAWALMGMSWLESQSKFFYCYYWSHIYNTSV